MAPAILKADSHHVFGLFPARNCYLLCNMCVVCGISQRGDSSTNQVRDNVIVHDDNNTLLYVQG
jgi:hypothetical protein